MTIDAQIEDMASLWPDFSAGRPRRHDSGLAGCRSAPASDVLGRHHLSRAAHHRAAQCTHPSAASQILSPPSETRPGDPEGRLPHVYYSPNGDVTLCMLDPDSDDWSPFDSLAHTTVPWIIEWLAAYEGGAQRASGRRAAATSSRRRRCLRAASHRKSNRRSGRALRAGANIADATPIWSATSSPAGRTGSSVSSRTSSPMSKAARAAIRPVSHLARNLENLMLMCARHHKLIDLDAVADHPESLLLTHEGRT